MRSPKVPNQEILGAQHLSLQYMYRYMEKVSKFFQFSNDKS